jgi:catechol 2,3-dioxygenase-like lactoylglutathione lyase family enzyme
MSRLQLALNVTDIDAAVDFYTKLFATPPRKRQPGYANFAIAEPPLKLVLFENKGAVGGSINHLGVEVESTDEVVTAIARLQDAELPTEVQEQTDCCYALQDKVWTEGPDAERWEIYVVHADTEVPVADTACCTPTADAASAPSGSVCCG